MILQYLGYAISIVLAITAVVCFGASIYFGYKYTDNFLPTQKSTKANTKYLLLCTISLFAAAFVVMTTESGFSWKTLFLFLGMLIVLSVFITIGAVVNLDTAEYLRKRNAPSVFSDEFPAWKIIKKSTAKPDADKDKKDK